ncbi:hypothetical protein TWF788_006794 [Orbilia oligospora]|uniref:Uncharacterized protein n=1 Tax=Orbilia oligospora TaxID=2813651 RepID=A0A7C8TVL8_ORBOL|nr:hypothetical protein TWF788_006794 [Orbilia oligospora]
MQGLILFLLSTSRFLGQGRAIVISQPEEALNREYYGVRIRDVLDHVYGTPPLQRRSDGELVPQCRPGSKPVYQNGDLTACSYETSVEDYNKAIRSIYAKRTRRSLEAAPPVYLFKRKWPDRLESSEPGGSGRYIINGDKHPRLPDDDEIISIPTIIPGEGADGFGPEDDMSLDEVRINSIDNSTLPENWSIKDGDGRCHDSGIWAKLEVVGSVRAPWCLFLYRTRNIGAIHFMSFLKASIDPMKPGPLLRASDNQTIGINTEFITSAWLPGDNDIWALCAEATKALLGRCHGEHEDTRGGWQIVRRDPREGEEFREYERSASFGMDPNTGFGCC